MAFLTRELQGCPKSHRSTNQLQEKINLAGSDRITYYLPAY